MRFLPEKRTKRIVNRFAWWPVTDPPSGITAWLEPVRIKQEREIREFDRCGAALPGRFIGEWVTTDVEIAPRRPSRLKPFLKSQQNYSLLWFASAFFWLWTLADELISIHMPPGFIEANPYARNMFGKFMWTHAFAHDLCYFLAYGSASFALAHLAQKYKANKFLAQLPGALWLIYFGLEHMDGFLGNVWAHLGWLINDAMIFGR